MLKDVQVVLKLEIMSKKYVKPGQQIAPIDYPMRFDALNYMDLEKQIKTYIRQFNKSHKLMKVSRFEEEEWVSRFTA